MDVHCHGAAPRRYRDPLEVVETFDPHAVDAALAAADAALTAGYSVAGYIAYEAGLLACGVAPPEVSTAEPLVALGIFAGAQAPLRVRPELGELSPFVAQIDRDRYECDLRAIGRALFEGDAYQVNYTVPFAFHYAGDPLALFEYLRRRADVPHASFVRHRERAIVSLSPESFFELDGESVRSKPMKGTSVPAAAAALSDDKNRAEHVMIVDLMRNDLGRICTRVAVPSSFCVERYPTFATMTATIEGTLAPERTFGDVVRALFPCGSVTGAPKRSAMRAIAMLEAGRRSVAMGTIGYCEGPRRGAWSVAIRTAVLDERTGLGELRIGGGIVADSEATAEWAEILVKRRAFEVGERTGLIETLRVTPAGTALRAEAHLERLERSAFALGLSLDMTAARTELHRVARRPRRRDALLRLTLDPTGRVRAVERALDEAPADAAACVAPGALFAADPALRHKTMRRTAYDAALAYAAARGCFEAVLLNDRGEIADGARTSLFVERAGALATPALDCGAVAGVLRAELLADGRAYESVLFPHDLRAHRVFVGNGARGLIAATLRFAT